MEDNALEIDGVYTAYDKADVLRGVSLSVRAGEITCLLGSNGVGKTTLIRSVLGLTAPRLGQIKFNGRDITGLATHKTVAMGIACIPEGRKVFPQLTVAENLRIGGYKVRSESVIRRRMGEAYESFPKLAERRSQLAGTLSGGEQAMLSIGRGLMASPELLMVDEPSLGLSPLFVDENFKLIERINQRGVTIFLVEQNVRQTLAIAHYGYVLGKGAVVAEGAPEALRENEEVSQAYFG